MRRETEGRGKGVAAAVPDTVAGGGDSSSTDSEAEAEAALFRHPLPSPREVCSLCGLCCVEDELVPPPHPSPAHAPRRMRLPCPLLHAIMRVGSTQAECATLG